MSGEWKPGDVAIVERRGDPVAAVRGDGELTGWWLTPFGSGLYDDARLLVVIDPEDREQVERLARDYCERAYQGRFALADIAVMQDALREFANPTPKPDEPRGLGAVVEDDEGVLWTRTALDDYAAWLSSVPGGTPTRTGWSEVAAVRVLSEGVTA